MVNITTLTQPGRQSKHRLFIKGGPISALDANLIKECVSSPMYAPQRWYLFFSNCYPEDDQAFHILGQTISESCAALGVSRFDYSIPQHRRMLECIFGVNSSNRPKYIDGLRFKRCKLDLGFMWLLHDWLASGMIVREYHIVQYFIFQTGLGTDYDGFAYFMAMAYRNVSHRPKKIWLDESSKIHPHEHHFGFSGAPRYGDFACFHAWRQLKHLSVIGSDVSEIKGLQFLTQLKSIKLSEYQDAEISLKRSGLIDLIRKRDNQLKSLCLWNSNASEFETAALFQALADNKQVAHLDISWDQRSKLSSFSSDMLVHCLTKNTALKRLVIGNQIIDQNPGIIHDISLVLSTSNTSLEVVKAFSYFSGGFEYFPINSNYEQIGLEENRELFEQLHHYTFRNKSGRRILGKENDIPVGLWPFVLGRIRRLNVVAKNPMSFALPFDQRRRSDDISLQCQADAIYHILREGSLIFHSCGSILGKRKKFAAYEQEFSPQN